MPILQREAEDPSRTCRGGSGGRAEPGSHPGSRAFTWPRRDPASAVPASGSPQPGEEPPGTRPTPPGSTGSAVTDTQRSSGETLPGDAGKEQRE